MTRRLLVLRHSKTEHSFGVADLDRSLTERGRGQSRYVGEHARAGGIVPDAVVLSPSRRTKQTWELAAKEWQVEPPAAVDARIYDNTLEDLLDVIREADPATESLLLVGHNPSCELLADHLGSGTIEDGFQTGLLAVFELEGPWDEIDRPQAKLVATFREPH